MGRQQLSTRRILLFAEAVTMAHVARPLCFVRELDRSRYHVAIAAAPRVAPLVAAEAVDHLPLESVESREFLSALARGRPVYDAVTLQRYVEADLALIERHEPDLIVGDFRLSLSVSARMARVPYVSIASAYWSPYYTPPCWPVPSLPLTRWLPLGVAQLAFTVARPLAFAMHCRPLNRVRRRNGLGPLGSDLRRVYTDADHVVYSDLPSIFPTRDLPDRHRFIGAVLWQPAGMLPAWWSEVPTDRPCVYVTLGSSGQADLLVPIVSALASLPVTVLVATAGAALPTQPENVFQAPYLPGVDTAQRAQVLVCNGGMSTYQALAGGAQVLGIAASLDQFLSVQGFERAGVARMLRADRFSVARLRAEVQALLSNTDSAASRELRAQCLRSQFSAGAAALVAELVG